VQVGAADRRCASGRRRAGQPNRARAEGAVGEDGQTAKNRIGAARRADGRTPHTGAAALQPAALLCSAAPRTAAAGGSRSLGFRFWEREGETERAARREKPEEVACGAACGQLDFGRMRRARVAGCVGRPYGWAEERCVGRVVWLGCSMVGWAIADLHNSFGSRVTHEPARV
jgi:hypothetical protein